MQKYILLIILGTLSITSAIEPVLVVHGGAGDIPEGAAAGKLNGLRKALERGYRVLVETKNSLNAVEEAVRLMEDDDYFNAGYGSVLTAEGEVEMDASIMRGSDLKAGCVSLVKDIAHPITLARLLMEKTEYTFFAGDGAKNFGMQQGMIILPAGALISKKSRQALENYRKATNSINITNLYSRSEVDIHIQGGYVHETETVGAVAIDIYGNISAATSTGGIMFKPAGRVGDTPVLGSGTYADNVIGGVSATGDGEYLLRFNLAQQILQRIQYKNMTAQEATTEALTVMKNRIGGKGGAITIDHNGRVGIYFVSKQMAWGYRQGHILRYGANKNQTYEETVNDDTTERDSESIS